MYTSLLNRGWGGTWSLLTRLEQDDSGNRLTDRKANQAAALCSLFTRILIIDFPELVEVVEVHSLQVLMERVLGSGLCRKEHTWRNCLLVVRSTQHVLRSH